MKYRRGTAVLISTAMFILLISQAFSSENSQTSKRFEKKLTITTRYLVYLPENYHKEKKEQWPLMIFLHGSGECGEDIGKVKANGPPRLVSQGKKFPFIIVSPQCHKSGWGWNDIDSLMEILKRVETDYRVDKDRIYLTGLSMGGTGTWTWAARYPEIFAAIAPVCGASIGNNAYRVKNLPVWIFHGGKDDVVPVANAIDMDKRLGECGADVRLTIYSNIGHESWIPAYADENLYTWFLSHRREPIKELFVTNYTVLECPLARAPIRIDGDLSEWAHIPFLTIATDGLDKHMRRVKLKKMSASGGKSSYKGPADCSAKIRMQWDNKGLYMAAEVTDDKIVCDQKGETIWIGDCIDLGLSFRDEKDHFSPYIMPLDYNQGGNEYFSDKDFVFGFSPSGPDQIPEYHLFRNPIRQDNKDDRGIELASKITSTGYTLEVFLSKEYLDCSHKLKPGQEIGFNCGIYDLDQKSVAQDFSKSEWPGTAGNPWSPDTFGRLLLK